MPIQRRIIDRGCVIMFCFGAAAIVFGILSFALLNPVLFQVYLVTTVVVLVGLLALRLLARGPLNNRWAAWGTALPCGFLGLSLYLIPLCTLVSVAELRNQSYRNLKEITSAIQKYHAKHDHLPPAAICDVDGRPLLSWRVAILPFLGEEELHRQFNLDEAWDSPWNAALLRRMPAAYRTPLQPGESAPPHTTFYQVFVGPGTVFEPGTKLQIPRDFPDGIESTILLVDAGTPVPWAKPEDLAYDKNAPLPALGAFRREKGRFPFQGGEGTGMIMLVLCDGTVRSFSWPGGSERSRETLLRSIITRNDRQFVPRDW